MVPLETLISSRVCLAYCIDLKDKKFLFFNLKINLICMTLFKKLLHLLTSLRLISGLKGWGTDERPLMAKDSSSTIAFFQASVLICKIICENVLWGKNRK